MSENIFVYWFNSRPPDQGGPTVEPYDPRVHLLNAFKFLYWEAAGNAPAVLAVSSSFMHKTVRDMAQQLLPDFPLSSGPCAAGTLQNGKIVEWVSKSMHIETPTELRPAIHKALGITSE